MKLKNLDEGCGCVLIAIAFSIVVGALTFFAMPTNERKDLVCDVRLLWTDECKR